MCVRKHLYKMELKRTYFVSIVNHRSISEVSNDICKWLYPALSTVFFSCSIHIERGLWQSRGPLGPVILLVLVNKTDILFRDR